MSVGGPRVHPRHTIGIFGILTEVLGAGKVLAAAPPAALHRRCLPEVVWVTRAVPGHQHRPDEGANETGDGQPTETGAGRELVRAVRTFCVTGIDPSGRLEAPGEGVLPVLMHRMRDAGRAIRRWQNAC